MLKQYHELLDDDQFLEAARRYWNALHHDYHDGCSLRYFYSRMHNDEYDGHIEVAILARHSATREEIIMSFDKDTYPDWFN